MCPVGDDGSGIPNSPISSLAGPRWSFSSLSSLSSGSSSLSTNCTCSAAIPCEVGCEREGWRDASEGGCWRVDVAVGEVAVAVGEVGESEDGSMGEGGKDGSGGCSVLGDRSADGVSKEACAGRVERA